jgi:4-amino-4-deoxy-L-arabinose transferase-like glycosyltransferase
MQNTHARDVLLVVSFALIGFLISSYINYGIFGISNYSDGNETNNTEAYPYIHLSEIVTTQGFDGLRNIHDPFLRYRLFSVFIPLAASPLTFIIGPERAFIILNCLMLLLATLVLYLMITKLFSREVGMLSAFLFAFSIPILLYSSLALIDMGAWLFLILITYLVVQGVGQKKPCSHIDESKRTV